MNLWITWGISVENCVFLGINKKSFPINNHFGTFDPQYKRTPKHTFILISFIK